MTLKIKKLIKIHFLPSSPNLTNYILKNYIINNLRKLSDFIPKNNVIPDKFDKK